MGSMKTSRTKNVATLEAAFAVRKAVFLMDRAVERALAEAGRVTLMQLTLLRIVEDCPRVTQREVAAIVNLTEAAVSRQVEGLIRKKYVVRKKIPEQRRAMALSLTVEGEKELQAAMRTGFTVIERFYAGVPNDDMATIGRAFSAITEGMKDTCTSPLPKKL